MHTCVVCLFVCVRICDTTYTHAHTKYIQIRDREGARESKKDSRGSLACGSGKRVPLLHVCIYACMCRSMHVCVDAHLFYMHVCVRE